MFKRMSVLVRRDGDTRTQFSEGWLRHADLIAELPGVRSYLQNHVEEDLATTCGMTLRVDGFVELCFDSPEAMATAFASPGARAMAQDEPNFLGHGSGYALSTYAPLEDAGEGSKLIVAVSEIDPQGLQAAIAAKLSVRIVRDQVVSLIAKPGMAPPQPVGSFLHVHCPDAQVARDAGHKIAAMAESIGVAAAIFRVRTVRIV